MAKSVANQVSYKESPLGIGSMAEKDSASIPNSGGSGASELKSWNMPKGDGTGKMAEQKPNAGTCSQESIGGINPKSRHEKEAL